VLFGDVQRPGQRSTYLDPTDWDRQAARIVYQRPPGNQSPDTDPESMYRPATAALQWFLADK